MPPTVRIADIISGSQSPIFSFEFSPPKTDEGEQNLRDALAKLTDLGPAFASVTYGAGGSDQTRTFEVTKWLKRELGIETMAHLTCVGATADELRGTLDELAAAGIENVLALRGDPPRGQPDWRPQPGCLTHAEELVRITTEEFGLCCGAACFPEGHPDSRNPLDDLQFLKAKVDAGASFLISQLFFDNELYSRFVKAARFSGIEVPILPGIMPITSTKQIQTITGTCSATLPAPLNEQLLQRLEDPESVAELGVAYATLQCAELLASGAPGIHFFTLNRSPATRAIVSALKLQSPWEPSSTATITARSLRPVASVSQPLANLSA